MKIEIDIANNKLQELYDAFGYSLNKKVDIETIKTVIHDLLMSYYEIGAIEKAKDTTKPVIDQDMFEVK